MLCSIAEDNILNEADVLVDTVFETEDTPEETPVCSLHLHSEKSYTRSCDDIPFTPTDDFSDDPEEILVDPSLMKPVYSVDSDSDGVRKRQISFNVQVQTYTIPTYAASAETSCTTPQLTPTTSRRNSEATTENDNTSTTVSLTTPTCSRTSNSYAHPHLLTRISDVSFSSAVVYSSNSPTMVENARGVITKKNSNLTEDDTEQAFADATNILDKQLIEGNVESTVEFKCWPWVQVQEYLFQEVDLTPFESEIDVDSTKKKSFWDFFTCFAAKLPAEVIESRKKIFCVAKLGLNREVEEHRRIMNSLYMLITESNHAPPPVGRHWVDCGFQGNDPSTDLRSAGMLGIFHLLAFCEQQKNTASNLYYLSQDQHQNFPLAVVSLCMTKITMDALRAGKLDRFFPDLDCISFTSTVHQTLLTAFFHTWKRKQLRIPDFDNVRKELVQQMQKPLPFLKKWAKLVTLSAKESELLL